MPEIDVNNDGIPDQWTLNTPEQIKLSVNDGNIRVKNTLVEKWPYIRSRQFELEPNKNYLIQLETTEAYNPDAISFKVTGVMGKMGRLTRSNSIYTATITTSKDFTNGKCSLALYVNKDYELKNVLIAER
jgi:hypothetical protein